MQSSTVCRSKLLAEGAMDRVVVTMSSYRKLKKPLTDADEEEFLMELCNVLAVCCMDAAGKQQFLDFEGIQLMFIILRNRQLFRIGCIKARAAPLRCFVGAFGCFWASFHCLCWCCCCIVLYCTVLYRTVLYYVLVERRTAGGLACWRVCACVRVCVLLREQ